VIDQAWTADRLRHFVTNPMSALGTMLPELGSRRGHIRSTVPERLLAEKIASVNAKAATRAKERGKVNALACKGPALSSIFSNSPMSFVSLSLGAGKQVALWDSIIHKDIRPPSRWPLAPRIAIN
jgi:hypothetical protein